MRLTKPFVRALVIAVLAAGCGGATGGERRKMISFAKDAGNDATLPPYVCPTAVAPLDCTAPVTLHADGHLVDFSPQEWSNNSGKWCDESGYHGSIYSYKNTAQFPNDVNMQRVDVDGSFHLVLGVSGGSYGGGGLAFEGGCMDVSQFTGVQFTAAIVSGSLASCPLQLQLATFDQRPTDQTPPGGCTPGNCFAYPTATALPVLSSDPANPTKVVLPWGSFSRVVAGTLAQVVALQWQVNATGGNCMVELAFDDIGFIPAPPAPDGGSDDGGSDGGAVD
jgi:hypothetical protein